MKKRWVAVLAVILCMSLLTALAMSVSATEQGSLGSVPSSGASSTASASSDLGGSSGGNSSNASPNSSGEVQSGSSSDVTSGIASDTSSGDDVSDGGSSADSTSAGQTNSGSEISSGTENTSSGTTSSKVNRPIQSTGQGGNNFIDQDGDQLASQNASTSSGTASGDGLVSEGYVEDDDSDTNFFQGKATTVAENIYKVIWIPILLALICVAALVFVNIWFNKKYPKPQKADAKGAAKKDGPHRRKKNKKFKFTIED